MKYVNKRDLVTAINKSTEELHQKIDMHCYLLTALLRRRTDDEALKQLAFPTHSTKENTLKQAIIETIDVLEESRKAFKSKRLEVLRKKLARVLIEAK